MNNPIDSITYYPADSLLAADDLLIGAKAPVDSIAQIDISATPGIVVTEIATTTPAEPQPPQWTQGLEGTQRPIYVGDNSGVLTIVATIFLLMMLSYRQCRRLFASLWQELLGMRHRANVFDEHTGNETRALVLMALQWCVCTGLLLYSAIAIGFGGWSTPGALAPSQAFADTASLICLTIAYYLFQLSAYWTIGYVFSDPTGRTLFVQGFTSSQSLLGFALLIPALTSIFYPTAASVMVIIGASIYVLARIIFIVKGLRIFYTNFYSTFYFILYLCTLEIIPAIFVYKLALLCTKSPFISI